MNKNEIIASQSPKVNRSKEFQTILNRWLEYYDYPLNLAVNELRKFHSDRTIAKLLELDPSRISRRFPRGDHDA